MLMRFKDAGRFPSLKTLGFDDSRFVEPHANPWQIGLRAKRRRENWKCHAAGTLDLLSLAP
jgi:hypothetical protein